ncbi:MAG: proton-conducting transporter membrane subunit [Pseudomonadota bacterium]|jgi:NADH-quinone oxidoreductase subunit L
MSIWWLSTVGKFIIGAPVLALIAIIFDRIVRHDVRESFIKKCLTVSQVISICAGIVCSTYVVSSGKPLEIGALRLVSLSTQDLVFALRIDRISVSFVLISCFLGGIVGLFASRYLHRDPGYFRFFILYHIFLVGIHAIFQGAGLPTVYIGWELIGITSALLISFFAFRKQTVSNSLRAFWAYRITDSGILVATLLAMHHGIEGFSERADQHPHLAILFACLLSAIGKSAQFPFGRWLPKAMEGPTPSSAIFYGGLSVHAGMYLMLRAAHVYGLPRSVAVCMVVVGLFSIWYATIVGRIQSDAKSMLAYASMAQVGFMFIEVALGFNQLAIFHFVSHAMLRTYQLLNAASVMHDRYAFEHVLGRDKVTFQPVKGNRAFSQYAYAFWESIDGAFGRLSLLGFAESVGRACRAFEQAFGEIILEAVRHVMFYLRHPLKSVHLAAHRLEGRDHDGRGGGR